MTARPGKAVAALSTAVVVLLAPAARAGHPFGRFTPLSQSATCTEPGGRAENPLELPRRFAQDIIAAEPQFPDFADQNVLNEGGDQAGRFLYRTHETFNNSAVTATDLGTVVPETRTERNLGDTHVVAQRPDWERFDGIRWTPWNTIIAAEETDPAAIPDPNVPQATAGLVYEIDPTTGVAVARPAIGSRSHEGLDFDRRGYLYGISENDPGYIYRFKPDEPGNLASGRLFALVIGGSTQGRTGAARWRPLDRTAVQVSSDDAAGAAGATSYDRPEDVEISVNHLFVAITDEDRVLSINLRSGGAEAFVSNYVKAGVNAPAAFLKPDNLARDRDGNLFITEDPGGNFPVKTTGDDIWVARRSGTLRTASKTVRFASLTDCDAEPTGIYFGPDGGGPLYVNIQHRGGDTIDKALAVRKKRRP